ncbi:MAG TPA: hypothetical protein VMH87_01110 [Pseudomonadales bacterium]|nr:hypothetical protein [Pseudomonadales bacterium]
MSENEQDFDALRRLLALKRHEIPPPGYFENFSGNVIARIHAGEAAAELPLLLRFIQWFERKPALPVTFASSLCMVLLYGIVTIQQSPMAGMGFAPQSTGSMAVLTTAPTGVVDPARPFNGSSEQTNNPAANDSSYFGSPSSAPLYHEGGFAPAGN